MSGNRKAFEQVVLDFMGKITKGGHNRTIYENLFKRMSDSDIEQMVERIENGYCLPIYASNWDENEHLDFKQLVKLSREYGVELETQLVIFDIDTGLEVITNETYFTGTAEIRKQRQMLVKKFGAAKDDTRIDDLPGQVVGKSRGTGISNPEVQVLITLGLPTVAKELYDTKGGDVKALEIYRTELTETGQTNINETLRRGSGVKSLATAHFLLRGRHIDNNLNKR